MFLLECRHMNSIKQKLRDFGFVGEIDETIATRDAYSHDASMFELVPEVVVYPKDAADVGTLVNYVATAKKSENRHISLTARSAGTDMSGGSISQSVLMDMTKHFNQIFEVNSVSAHAQPGVYYRDFEIQTLLHNALMPSFPASRDLCTIGGMVANNSGGEKSLQYGKTEKFVTQLKVVFTDGKEYVVQPLDKIELDKKMAQNDFEGRLYKQVFDLLESHYDEIKAAKPNVSKDSTAYHIWNVWDRETGIFDLNQVIIGSQGTLGMITDIHFRLVPAPKQSGSLIVFLNNMDHLGDIIKSLVAHKPATLEGFDDHTLLLSFKLFFYFYTTLGLFGMLRLGLELLPTLLQFRRGVPKMVIIVQFTADTDSEVALKVHQLKLDLGKYGKELLFEEDETENKERKFFVMRRQAFNLLRKTVHDKHTAPFIDDLVVPPEHLPEFLPKLRKIIKKYDLLATVQGHFGDGNFHVIPLMKIEDPKERVKLEPAMLEVNNLVLSYGGSLSGEHNDGMIRGPWLHMMYSRSMMHVFKDLKNIFDPDNIFNPDKKTDAHWEFSVSHIREHF